MQERRGFNQTDVLDVDLSPRMTLDEKIAQAQRHVDSGRLIIARQQAIVARHGGECTADLLERFERSQQIFEQDLADLLNMKVDAVAGSAPGVRTCTIATDHCFRGSNNAW